MRVNGLQAYSILCATMVDGGVGCSVYHEACTMGTNVVSGQAPMQPLCSFKIPWPMTSLKPTPTSLARFNRLLILLWSAARWYKRVPLE